MIQKLKSILNEPPSAMISDEEFLAAELKMGIGFHNKEFSLLCNKTAEQMHGLGIKTVLDYGSGTGVYAEAYRQQGFDAYAYEIWAAHRKYIKENAPQLKIVTEPITTDLLHFIEVAEHMTDEELHDLMTKVEPKYILFSSTSLTTEWDAAWGHINVKQQHEWVTFFSQYGYKWEKSFSYPTDYTKLFLKDE